MDPVLRLLQEILASLFIVGELNLMRQTFVSVSITTLKFVKL
ncbi:2273_t:CDS:2 [Entrophospora sp. SA101]|nr:2273_t:CDS:2 [Entrophospora sp. SA101]